MIDAIRAGWLRVGDGTAFEFARVADPHRALGRRPPATYAAALAAQLTPELSDPDRT